MIAARRRGPDGGWLFHVVYVVAGDDGGEPTTVQQWLPAELVQPADCALPDAWPQEASLSASSE